MGNRKVKSFSAGKVALIRVIIPDFLFGNLTHWLEYPPYKRVVGGSIPPVSTNPILTDSDTLGVLPTRKGGGCQTD